eukprot:6745219-Prymnesium_polylepis.1
MDHGAAIFYIPRHHPLHPLTELAQLRVCQVGAKRLRIHLLSRAQRREQVIIDRCGRAAKEVVAARRQRALEHDKPLGEALAGGVCGASLFVLPTLCRPVRLSPKVFRVAEGAHHEASLLRRPGHTMLDAQMKADRRGLRHECLTVLEEWRCKARRIRLLGLVHSR